MCFQCTVFIWLTCAKNDDVLRKATIPNAILNTDIDTVRARSRFIAGDWKSAIKLLQDSYDLVLTSETLYHVESYADLLTLFTSVVNPTSKMYNVKTAPQCN